MSLQNILVINPNCNETVTAGLRESLARFSNQANIACCTLDEGPFGIESDDDIDRVVPLIVQKISSSTKFDAFVIACYSDPGLMECRELSSKPVYGMQKSAIETAASFSGKFGVLALSNESIARHASYILELGFADRLTAELPLDISVDEASNGAATLGKVLRNGRRLVDEFAATSVILGCAGMAGHRAVAERELAVPVIEPAQAALKLAIEAA